MIVVVQYPDGSLLRYERDPANGVWSMQAYDARKRPAPWAPVRVRDAGVLAALNGLWAHRKA